MADKEVTKRELLERWSVIEQQDDEDDTSSAHPVKRRRLRQLKEQWFSDAFTFLIYLPKESHVWCGYRDLMGPLLETFFNYFKEEARDSPLKLLWNRISDEMRCCSLCIHQHHQAQDMYSTEYEQSCIGPLLDVLRTLDEERICKHLKDLNARIVRGDYDPAHDYGEVVSVMFEVLMFPILLIDQSLVTEFQTFIEAMDNSHELTLDGHQQYPGVYALLFLKSRRMRSIGLRLAGHMGKLRRSTDLDPLQHLLKKCISILDTENTESATETSRPRIQLDRITVWLGMKALIGFLEPPTFEEGILDRYPIFLSIVLNHISDDSLEFSHAVNCLRLLFEKLGCKLWLRATLSASVMRNTLLGQCFHTRNEKSHKEIFDLFQPFLQSLEALQDGEHEKQRRQFLYFLLHQVPVSSNFSILMRKKACQIALLIVLRGYRMDPPSPPYECAHMWGPSLVRSLKDLSLHSPLRQPALDLIQTIIVSDASALTSMVFSGQLHPSDKPIRPANYNVDDDDEIQFDLDIEEKDVSCWKEFTTQHKIISQVDGSWMCVPMLWYDVSFQVDPSVLPLSFSKAVFWALSRFSMVEPESNSRAMDLSPFPSEISYLFGWKVPSGSDDGGDGTESRNSIRNSTMCLPLVRTFKRLMTHFTLRMEQIGVRKQWTWEPMMSNSLILLLVEPNDNTRQVSRLIIEQVSNVRGLTGGLQFLCADASSLSAVLLGMGHAMKLVQLDSVLSNFQTLHHLFFILSKLLKEGKSFPQNVSQNLVSDVPKFSTQGGFLKQPLFDSSPDCEEHKLLVSSTLWNKFSSLLSQAAWPSILKCLDGGKTFTHDTLSQMTCIRLLEVMPVVFEKLPGNSRVMLEASDNLKWLHDLIDWGKSSLAILVRYWKQTLASLLDLIEVFFGSKSASAINNLKKLISEENVLMDEVSQLVARLSVSVLDESYASRRKDLKSNHRPSKESLDSKTCSPEDPVLLLHEEKVKISDVGMFVDHERDQVIILSDDEKEPDISAPAGFSRSGSSQRTRYNPDYSTDFLMEKINSDSMGVKQTTRSFVQAEPLGSKSKQVEKKDGISHYAPSPDNSNLNSSVRTASPKDSITSQHNFPDPSKTSNRTVQPNANKSLKTSDEVIRHVVSDNTEDDDAWQFSFFNAPPRQKSLITKPIISVPKRQVIQLSLPVQNKSGSMKMDAVKRFKPSRLDDWYRPVLESDVFVDAVIASESDKDSNQDVSKLKKVPVCFQSPDEYVEIFRPLVLEEFKAQLKSSFQETVSAEEMRCGSLNVMSVEKIDDFHVIRFVHDENEFVGPKSLWENDLVLLTRQPLQTSSSDVHAIGKVERRDSKRKSKFLTIRLYLQGCPRLNRVRKLLTERSKWYATQIMSITPQLREFQALSSIREIPFLPIILNPITQSSDHYKSRTEILGKLSQPLQQVIKSSYNSSQLQAINVAIGPFNLKNDLELTLIQGPPGTGKTRTILAIISCLLASSQAKDANRSRNDNTVHSYSNTNQKISQSAAVARAWQDAALARQLNNDMEKNKSPRICTRGRILICAQSNAAVDELVSRISSEGLYGSNGDIYKPYLVRVGNAKTVHPNSLSFFIDTLVETRLGEEKKNTNEETDSLTTLRANLEKTVDQIRYYEAKQANLQDGNSDTKEDIMEGEYKDVKVLSEPELKFKLRQLYEKKNAAYKDLASVQARERKASEEIRSLRHKFRTEILKEAEIVVTTLSGCGGDLYGVCSESITGQKFSSSENTLFDAVVIDEAAQALEPATLIPLQLLKSMGTKCIMVGDPKQLPATVISNIASKYLFHCSMFERLQRAGYPVIMLSQQYRMHPEICRFPSSHFYDGKLLNGDQMTVKSAPFHETWCLGPYIFFDIVDGQERRDKNAASMSMYNEFESDAAVEVLRFLKKRYPSEFFGGRIGVITPYKRQQSLLRSRFSREFGPSITSEMEFNTVDGFQGREVDILLLSTVRAAGGSCSDTPRGGSSNIGFVADIRRMNVALTRAKLSLWIFGNAKTLQTNRSWAALLEDAKQRNLIISGKKPYNSSILNSQSENSQISGTQSKKHSSETKRKYVGTSEGDDVSPAAKGDNKRARNGGKLKSTVEENQGNNSHKRRAYRASDEINNVPKNDTAKRRDNDKNHKPSKPAKGEMPVKVGTSSSEKSFKETDEKGGSSKVDTVRDSIMKRKQQREAVEALLSSSLISSKKTESSVKRNISTTNNKAHMVRPPKPRKDS